MSQPSSPRALVSLACALLLGCGGGSGGGARPGTASLCGDFQHGQAGDYVIENNTWGKGSVTGYRQCVGIASAQGGGVDAVWEWSWPQPAVTVRGYPEVIYGQKPWNPSTTSKLPRVVDEVTTARVELGFSSSRDGTGNLAFDIWLTASNVKPAWSDHLPLVHELMIWLDTFGGMSPAGGQVDTVTIDGIQWDLFITTATWGTEPWQYIAYRPGNGVPSPTTIDVRKFLDHLKARGSITGAEWLASVELGNEVVVGTGRTTLSSFDVTIE
jgi:hypothetical protein